MGESILFQSNTFAAWKFNDIRGKHSGHLVQDDNFAFNILASN